jgi:hypothetical protein
VRYWNNAEKTLEITMDVLDDHLGESKLIVETIKWLTYGASLQQMREFGTMSDECDMLDEVKLSANHGCTWIWTSQGTGGGRWA